MKAHNEPQSPANEMSLPRVWRQSQRHDIGTIAAFRRAREYNRGRIYTFSENNDRNAILRAKLLMMGYGVASITIHLIDNFNTSDAHEVYEKSHLVVDLEDKKNLKDALIGLGKLFEQDSIMFQEAGTNNYLLISSSTCADGYPGRGKVGAELKLDSAMLRRSGEFFSCTNGRVFEFEGAKYEKLDKLSRIPPTEIRGIVALAKSM